MANSPKSVTLSTPPPLSASSIVVRRTVKLYKMNNRLIFSLPQDLTDIVKFQAGETLLFTANPEIGEIRISRADGLGVEGK